MSAADDHTRDLDGRRWRRAAPRVRSEPVRRPEELIGRVLDGGEYAAAEMSLAVA